MQHTSSLKLIGVCGRAGAGKDSFYGHVLRPRGFLRWQMALHYKVWLAATLRYPWDDIFYDKPPEVRKVLQEEITDLRYEWDEEIWLRTLQAWVRAMWEIVGVECAGIAVTDRRFLIEMRGIKKWAAKFYTSRPPTSRPTSPPSCAATAPRSSSTARRS
jgi:hypothetical protein